MFSSKYCNLLAPFQAANKIIPDSTKGKIGCEVLCGLVGFQIYFFLPLKFWFVALLSVQKQFPFRVQQFSNCTLQSSENCTFPRETDMIYQNVSFCPNVYQRYYVKSGGNFSPPSRIGKVQTLNECMIQSSQRYFVLMLRCQSYRTPVLLYCQLIERG